MIASAWSSLSCTSASRGSPEVSVEPQMIERRREGHEGGHYARPPFLPSRPRLTNSVQAFDSPGLRDGVFVAHPAGAGTRDHIPGHVCRARLPGFPVA